MSNRLHALYIFLTALIFFIGGWNLYFVVTAPSLALGLISVIPVIGAAITLALVVHVYLLEIRLRKDK